MNNRLGVLLVVVLAYGAASLSHHVHNAEFLDDYPNMPAWLSRAWVYAAWCSVTAVGITGVALVRRQRRIAGLCMLGIYGACGLDGLGHYAVAPVSAHTATANVTIWLEGATGLLLLVAVVLFICRVRSQSHGRVRNLA